MRKRHTFLSFYPAGFDFRIGDDSGRTFPAWISFISFFDIFSNMLLDFSNF